MHCFSASWLFSWPFKSLDICRWPTLNADKFPSKAQHKFRQLTFLFAKWKAIRFFFLRHCEWRCEFHCECHCEWHRDSLARRNLRQMTTNDTCQMSILSTGDINHALTSVAFNEHTHFRTVCWQIDESSRISIATTTMINVLPCSAEKKKAHYDPLTNAVQFLCPKWRLIKWHTIRRSNAITDDTYLFS